MANSNTQWDTKNFIYSDTQIEVLAQFVKCAYQLGMNPIPFISECYSNYSVKFNSSGNKSKGDECEKQIIIYKVDEWLNDKYLTNVYVEVYDENQLLPSYKSKVYNYS